MKQVEKLLFKKEFTEKDIEMYVNALKQRMIRECVHCQANIAMADLVVKLQVENRKLKKKGYEFQKLKDALHAKDVETEKLKDEIKNWKKEHNEYKKLVRDKLKVKNIIRK